MFGNKKQTQATVLSINEKLITLLNWGMGVFHALVEEVVRSFT